MCDMCDTQLGYSPSCSPWAVHMSPICTPENTQFRAKAKYEWGEHLLVFLQSQEQLFTFCFNQELQWCRVTLMKQQTGEGMRKIGSGVRQTAFWLRKAGSSCCSSLAALVSMVLCVAKKQQIVLENINYNPDETVTEPPSAVRKHARRLLSIDESSRKSLWSDFVS